jgi:hypothetical protein
MVRFTLQYNECDRSVSLMKDRIVILYAKIQQPLCHTDVHSYAWSMSLSYDTIIVSFNKTKWSYSVDEVKLEKTVTLCTAPTVLPNGFTMSDIVALGIAVLLVCCGITMSVTAAMVGKEHIHNGVILYSLERGSQMNPGDKLCNSESGKCVVLSKTQCKLFKEGEEHVFFDDWSRPHRSFACTLHLQNDGNLVMYHGQTVIASSNSQHNLDCTILTFRSNGNLYLNCGRSWKMTQ